MLIVRPKHIHKKTIWCGKFVRDEYCSTRYETAQLYLSRWVFHLPTCRNCHAHPRHRALFNITISQRVSSILYVMSKMEN